MSKDLDQSVIEKVIQDVCSYPYRLKTSNGSPGGLIELPPDARLIIVGDLHSELENLKLILNHDRNYEEMKAGRRIMVLIGDTVHDDQTGMMRDMKSSVEILEFIILLMAELPKGVIYLKGNHDTFDERLVKSGIFQGKELKKALIASRGQQFFEAAERLFDLLPVFIIGDGYVVVHAGPVRGGITREELIHIKNHPNKFHQLIWNRIHEFRGTPSQKEYGHKDLTTTLEKLGLEHDTFFIIGHNPLWGTGEKTGVWLDVLGIKKHHIIYSGQGSRAPYFLIQNKQLETRFALGEEGDE